MGSKGPFRQFFNFAKMALLNSCMILKIVFWPKAFFWSNMKMTIRKFFNNMSQGPPNPGFMQDWNICIRWWPGYCPKSFYISHVVSNFNGTEIEIWAGFGPFGITEKKNWANYEKSLRALSWAKFYFLKVLLHWHKHRLENRCVLRLISNMNFHSWAVLGSQGFREKLP